MDLYSSDSLLRCELIVLSALQLIKLGYINARGLLRTN
jgi:hypothetical protein